MRKQAQMTMRCMQALVRVQARVRARRLQLTHDKLRSKMEDEYKRFRHDEEAQKMRNQLKKLQNEQCHHRRDRALAYALAFQVLKFLIHSITCHWIFYLVLQFTSERYIYIKTCEVQYLVKQKILF